MLSSEIHTSPIYQHAQLLPQQYPADPSPLRIRSIPGDTQATYSEPMSSSSSSGYATSVQYRRASDPEPPHSMSSASTMDTTIATRSMSDLLVRRTSPPVAQSWPGDQARYGFHQAAPGAKVEQRAPIPLPQPPFAVPPCGLQGCDQPVPHTHEWQSHQ